MIEEKRILAVDPGGRRTGLAISDPTGTIANPLKIVEHESRDDCAGSIARISQKKKVTKIIVGQALDWDRSPSREGKRASRLADAIRKKTDLPVILWNEYGSTQAARDARLAMGLSRKKRQQDVDHLAATVILQSYLDAQMRKPGADNE